MKIEKISINGKCDSIAKSLVSSVDQGLMYGVGVFESFRYSDGKIFLFDEHFDRLNSSLKALEIAWDDDREKYLSWVTDVCRGLPEGKDAFVKFAVTAGRGGLGVGGEGSAEPTVIIYIGCIPPFLPTAQRGVVLDKTRLTKPVYFDEIGFRMKSLDYLWVRMAKKHLGQTGEQEGILLTPEGHIAEALTSNVFWVKDGELLTAPLSTGILAGTMRSYIMRTNKVQEVTARKNQLENADEIILTNGINYLRPLSKLGKHNLPGLKGPVFKKLHTTLSETLIRL